MIRIVSGIHKGRKIKAPPNLGHIPTADRLKEALFNIIRIQYDLNSISALDLFSGTGNISYEFASRGTKEIISIDQHYLATKFIDQTCQLLDLSIQIIQMNCFDFIEVCTKKFDIIFADPPYDYPKKSYHQLITRIDKKKILNHGGMLVIEHNVKTDLSHIDWFRESRKYGNSRISFFKKEADR